jgi:hypothetical protein
MVWPGLQLILEGLDGMQLVPKVYKVGLLRRSVAGKKRKKKPDVAAKENTQNDAKKAKTTTKATTATKATKATKEDQQEGPSMEKTKLNDLSGMASPPAEQPEDVNDMESPAGFKSDEPSPTSLEDSASSSSSSSSGTKRKAEVVVVVDDEDDDDAVRKQNEDMVLARELKKQKRSPMMKKKQGSLMGFFSKK